MKKKKTFEGSEGEDHYNKELLDIMLFSPDLKNTLISVNECVIEILIKTPLICFLLLPQRSISYLLPQSCYQCSIKENLGGEIFIKSYFYRVKRLQKHILLSSSRNISCGT